MYKTKKLNQIMLKPTGESPGSEEKETFLAPGTSAWTSEPTPDLLPSPVEGWRGAGLPQPDTIREDAVTTFNWM